MRQAFSLVELSIVLVILGLLTGGILTGQNLIRAAELRSVTTDVKKYQTAVMTFRDKYFYYPGDMPNATDFWGSAGGTGSDATCHDTSSTGTETCNGDADGTISNAGFSGETYEQTRFWQHLANAGLIEGSYTGIHGSGGAVHMQIGTTIPAVKLNNGGISISAPNCNNGSTTHWFERCYNHAFWVGKERSNWSPFNPLFSNEEAWNIDTKIDDGKPGTGKVSTVKGGSVMSPNCANSTDTETAEYTLTYSGAACSLRFEWE